ncbi:hypothetical protein JW756_06175 [Candidatus Woesearchaeota archaeon]|nr:hypothetical protein [Candidatus Woesearchaeota archaeon]
MKLATTTFEKRNHDKLLRAKEAAEKQSIKAPTIIDVGPGGLVSFLFSHIPAKNDDMTFGEKIKRKIIKPVEALLRKFYIFELKSSEPLETYQTFDNLNPMKVVIVDREQKVLDAIRKMMDKKELPDYFECLCMDITRHEIPYKGEVVVAYNVLQRTSNQLAALKTIVNSVKKNGILTTTIDYDLPDFKKLDKGLYQRIA